LELLREAAKRDGYILTLTKSNGLLAVLIGNKSEHQWEVDTSTPRLSARWRSAVEELYHQGYTRDLNGEGECFELKERGYKLFEELNPTQA
jgi:hypothetical protein